MAHSIQKYRAAAFVLLPVLIGAGAIAASHRSAPLPNRPAIAAEAWQPRVGDIVLTAADDLLGSQIASASGDAAVYSHIGLVVERDGRPAIVESSPFGAGHVAYADLEAFTTDPKTTDLMILRPTAAIDTARINREAAALVQAQVPFDFALDMRDGARIYCAELAYNLLRDAGLDVGTIPWVEAMVPLSGRRMIVTPDAFARTPSLQTVFRRAG